MTCLSFNYIKREREGERECGGRKRGRERKETGLKYKYW